MYTEGFLIELAIKWSGGLLALVAVWWAGRRSGKKSASLKNAKATLKRTDENRRARHDADRDARLDDDPASSLRDRWSRDSRV